MLQKQYSQEEIEKIKSLGGLDKLLETLEKRLEKQKKRHQGGNKWIGTLERLLGAYGYNPEGIRIGQNSRINGKAIKVWDRREFKDFDDRKELDIRGLQVALKKLRQWLELTKKN